MITDRPLVFSQQRVTRYRPVKKAILISITSMDGKFPYILSDKYERVLRLRFDDISEKMPGYFEIDDNQARKIAEIAEWANDQEDEIQVVVNCEAGISRSSGTAAAIAKFFLGDDMYYFNSGLYNPNMLVYSKVLQKLHKSS